MGGWPHASASLGGPDASLLHPLTPDLVDYEDDVADNSFNVRRVDCSLPHLPPPPPPYHPLQVLRGFVHLHGREAPLRLAAHISRLEQEHARMLALLPRDVQERWQQRKVEAATSDAALRWVFPDVILNEAAFRCDSE